MDHNILIVIPARYDSKRLPGKPLRHIDGVPLLKRVAQIAMRVCEKNRACRYVVATDSPKILDFCRENDLPCLMTPETCANGTERCWEAAKQMDARPDLVVNLQGDNVLCRTSVIQTLIDAWRASLEGGAEPADVFTPAALLSWEDLDRMIEAKKTTPFSGTTVEVSVTGKALCFSKQILPAIRKREEMQRRNPEFSPVRRHFGLYAYACAVLGEYGRLERSPYESSAAEGLEQNRFVYNEKTVRVVDVDARGYPTASGVDSEDDIRRVEEIVARHGWFNLE